MDFQLFADGSSRKTIRDANIAYEWQIKDLQKWVFRSSRDAEEMRAVASNSYNRVARNIPTVNYQLLSDSNGMWYPGHSRD